MSLADAIAAGLMVLGAAFMVLASIGVLRMPDIYLRLSAASKASTLGVACILLAVAEGFDDPGVVGRALAAVLFLFLTVPLASHLLARAAYLRGSKPWSRTTRHEG